MLLEWGPRDQICVLLEWGPRDQVCVLCTRRPQLRAIPWCGQAVGDVLMSSTATWDVVLLLGLTRASKMSCNTDTHTHHMRAPAHTKDMYAPINYYLIIHSTICLATILKCFYYLLIYGFNTLFIVVSFIVGFICFC